MAGDRMADSILLFCGKRHVLIYRTHNGARDAHACRIVRLATHILRRTTDIMQQRRGVHQIPRQAEPILQHRDPCDTCNVEAMVEAMAAVGALALHALNLLHCSLIRWMTPNRINARQDIEGHGIRSDLSLNMTVYFAASILKKRASNVG